MTLTPITLDLKGCARCHGDGHLALTFEPLTHPFIEESGLTFTHWAPCPTNGEPILFCVGPKPEEEEDGE